MEIRGEASEMCHSRTFRSNGNPTKSLRNTFQLNISSEHSNNSQTNMPNYSNTATSNNNLNVLPRKVEK